MSLSAAFAKIIGNFHTGMVSRHPKYSTPTGLTQGEPLSKVFSVIQMHRWLHKTCYICIYRSDDDSNVCTGELHKCWFYPSMDKENVGTFETISEGRRYHQTRTTSFALVLRRWIFCVCTVQDHQNIIFPWVYLSSHFYLMHPHVYYAAFV